MNDDHLKGTFHSSHYEVSVSLPNFNEEDITLKIKYRVLFILAMKPGAKTFSEVKILPEIVKPSDTIWNFENGQVVVKLFYSSPLGTEVVRDCKNDFNDTVFEVPKGFDIDERFGKDDTTIVSLDENVV